MSTLDPEALARLRNPRTAVRTGLADGEPPQTHAMVDPDDLRALLDAYDTARAEGVAAERARVVADLRARAKAQKSWTGESTAAAVMRAEADRYERGEHDKEGA